MNTEEVVSDFEVPAEAEEHDYGIWLQFVYEHDVADIDYFPAEEGKYQIVKVE